MTRFHCTIAALLVLCFGTSDSANATSILLPYFGSTVRSNQHIVVARVDRVENLRPVKGGLGGKPLGTADIAVTVVEQLKGTTPKSIRVVGIDLGDPETMDSPYLPLPEELQGQHLLLFLRRTDEKEVYRARQRFLVTAGHGSPGSPPTPALVRDIAFSNHTLYRKASYPLGKIRAMVAQLGPIQTAWASQKVNRKTVALAACRTALYSEYDPVVLYGAHELSHLQPPKDISEDILHCLERRQQGVDVRMVLLVVLVKIHGDEAAEVLEGLLKQHPGDKAIEQTLQRVHEERDTAGLRP